MRQHLRTTALLALTAAAVLLVGIPITATAKPPLVLGVPLAVTIS